MDSPARVNPLRFPRTVRHGANEPVRKSRGPTFLKGLTVCQTNNGNEKKMSQDFWGWVGKFEFAPPTSRRGCLGIHFMAKSRLLSFLIKELREVVPPTVFFAISFNLIWLTTQLILADYLISFASFMMAS
jgi:hypothetical protein